MAVNQNAPTRDVEEARDEVRERGLPRPARTHQSHHFPPSDAQVDVAQERHAGFVTEIHMLENNFFLERPELDGVRPVGDFA